MNGDDYPTNEELEREKKEFEIYDPNAQPEIKLPIDIINEAKSVFQDGLRHLMDEFESKTGCFIRDIRIDVSYHHGEYLRSDIEGVDVGMPKPQFFTEEDIGDMP